jgi:hypothetical protein
MGNWITGGTAAGGASGKLVSDLFTSIKHRLRDPAGNAYKLPHLIATYNDVIDEVRAILIQLGADVVTAPITITGDGQAQEFELPADFLAFVPNNLRPRIPATATIDFAHGSALVHADQAGAGVEAPVSRVAAPARFVLVASGTTQRIRFDSIPEAGHQYDGLYYQQVPEATAENHTAVYTPWLGLLDPLIKRCLELYLREGLEYTNEARMAWRAQATADAKSLLGRRHVQTHTVNPSLYRGV